MKKNLFLFLVFISLMFSGLQAQQANAWDFSALDGLEIWNTPNADAGWVECVSGSMIYHVTAGDPWVWSDHFDPLWVAGDIKYVHIRMKNTTDGTDGSFFFWPVDNNFIQYGFTQTANDTDYKDVYIDLTTKPEWVPGYEALSIRIDPIEANYGETGDVYVDFIHFLSEKPAISSIIVTGFEDATELNGVGNTLQMSASVMPDILSQDVDWIVDNTDIATISETGVLTAVSEGDVTVTATSKTETDKSGSVVIKVGAAAVLMTEVEVTSGIYEIQGIGNTLQMLVSVLPETTSDKSVVWSVDDETIATIDSETGVLTSVAAGTVVVTATAADGSEVSNSHEVLVYVGQKNAWEFTYDLENWGDGALFVTDLNPSQTDGMMLLEVTGADPNIWGPQHVPSWVVGDMKYLWLRMKNETCSAGGEWFIFPVEGNFAVVGFSLETEQTEFTDVYVDLTTCPIWTPDLLVKNFRIDPIFGMGVTGKVYIDFMRFLDQRPDLASFSLTTEGDEAKIYGVGNTLQMALDVVPSIALADVNWTVDNDGIASINEDGLLTSVALGDVVVTATSKTDATITATLTVSVMDNTSVELNFSEKVSVYPNPAKDVLYFNNASLIKTLNIIDITGQKIKNVNCNDSRLSVNIEDLNSGIYLVRVTSIKGEQTTLRFVKR